MRDCTPRRRPGRGANPPPVFSHLDSTPNLGLVSAHTRTRHCADCGDSLVTQRGVAIQSIWDVAPLPLYRERHPLSSHEPIALRIWYFAANAILRLMYLYRTGTSRQRLIYICNSCVSHTNRQDKEINNYLCLLYRASTWPIGKKTWAIFRHAQNEVRARKVLGSGGI